MPDRTHARPLAEAPRPSVDEAYTKVIALLKGKDGIDRELIFDLEDAAGDLMAIASRSASVIDFYKTERRLHALEHACCVIADRYSRGLGEAIEAQLAEARQ